jgi:ABC-2 type transport system permease protein
VTVQQGQEQAAAMEPEVESARDSAAGVRQALERGDREAAQREMLQLHQDLSVIQAALGPAQWLAIGLDEITGGSGSIGQTGEPQDVLLQIQKDMEALGGIGTSQLSDSEAIDAAAKLERRMGDLETAIEAFRREDPHVLVSPFAGETRPIGNTHLSPSDYYVPATIVLLLQHLCVTFGALSIVSERRTGTMELFQASPLAAIEVLVGKYLGYWLAGVLVASVLTGLLLFLVQVPMLGSWWQYVATLAALMFTSLGLGFLISILARSISQAVQYSMITLLASAFFSGFLLSLDMLRPTIRLVSWLIPASYGIQLLQDVMLRGVSFQVWRIRILTGMGLVLFIVAWRGLRREMART